MPVSVVWTEGLTSAAPGAPQTKKRKDTSPEHRHTAEEWETHRERIEKLFEDNELLDVVSIMEEEYGFKARYVLIPPFAWELVQVLMIFASWQPSAVPQQTKELGPLEVP